MCVCKYFGDCSSCKCVSSIIFPESYGQLDGKWLSLCVSTFTFLLKRVKKDNSYCEKSTDTKMTGLILV